MVHGIGIDLLAPARLVPLCEHWEDPFFARTFTPAELDQARGHENPCLYLAQRFAAKEAAFKALGISSEGVRLNEIETLNDAAGAPRITLSGDLAARAGAMGVRRLHVSLTGEGTLAAAVVLADG